MGYRFLILDVFTEQRFGGNPLGVVLDARGISDVDMQRIAAELGFSETTFLLPPEDPANTRKVRIFTPMAEVPFAGHPNIGSALALAFEQAITPVDGRASIVFDLVSQVAFNEYDPESTNFYGFYFGDGELFDDDAREITEILASRMRAMFNRIGIVEVKPSRASHLNKMVGEVFANDLVIRLGSLREKSQTIDVIKLLFGGAGAEH